MIERHITVSRELGLDDSFASDPDEFADMVAAVRLAEESMGEAVYGPTEREKPSLYLRRGLWVVEDIPSGGRITMGNVRSARPAEGMPPGHLPFLLGRPVLKDIKAGTPLQWEMIG